MKILSLAALFSLAFAVQASAKSTDAQIAEYLSMSPEEARYQQRCAQTIMPPVFGDSLIAEELEGRYHYVKRQGRNNGLLIEFDDRCSGLLQGPRTNAALPNRCRGTFVKFQYHPICRVENLYRVPNATSARSLALRIQVDRARADGMDLPDDPIQAAEAFVAAFQPSDTE